MTNFDDTLHKCVEHIFWDLIDLNGFARGRKNELTFVTGIIIRLAAVMELRMQDIASIFGVTKSTVTDYINYLEKKGYVTRERGTQDRRDIFIVPTTKGREWVQRCNGINFKYAEDGIERFTPKERNDFLRLLVKFVGDIDQPPYKNLLLNKGKEQPEYLRSSQYKPRG
ncbi:MAG TPA: MarR family transcriptional regulator [Methanocella sp.]|nr:MarR family transcriptional regulator [Methanocella sp.]